MNKVLEDRNHCSNIPAEISAGPAFTLKKMAIWPKSSVQSDQSLDQQNTELPSVKFLPISLRKKLSVVTKISLGLANEVLGNEERAKTPVVMASRHGESGTILELLAAVGSDQPGSPMLFSRSVHNASVGLWSIAAKSHAPHISIAAMNFSFRAGLMEAVLRLHEGEAQVLFVFVDQRLPDEFARFFRNPFEAFGGAFLLTQGDRLNFNALFPSTKDPCEASDFHHFLSVLSKDF